MSSRRSNPVSLVADCANCFGLCCVALPFAKSADFGFDKAGGDPCRNLEADFRCGIHVGLRDDGFKGCTVFDCLGAGQQVAQETFAGKDWRQQPSAAPQMFSAFRVMRQLHELLWFLSDAQRFVTAGTLHDDLSSAIAEVEALTHSSADILERLDVDRPRAMVNRLLAQTSVHVRGGVRKGRKAKQGKVVLRPGADLLGADLRKVELRGADLRGALMIAADLRGVSLDSADLIGADLRDADVRGADLSRCLFLTQQQVNSARGDAATKLPPTIERPHHWR